MKRIRLAGALMICAAVAAPAAADVTLTQKQGGKSIAGAMSGESVQYIKGTRMRSDDTMGGQATSTIIDVAAQQMIVLNHKRKEAEVHDMTRMAADLAKIPVSNVRATITPTGQTRQIAGSSCTVHTMQVTVPMEMGGNPLSIVMAGPVCLVKNGPGQADFAAFYKAAAEKGLFFGDLRAAKAQPGQAKGMTEMYREMAALGVPFAMEMNVKFEGAGPMAAMMSKMGGTSITSEVIAVSTDPIPDSTFEIPAGYKVSKR